MSVQLDDLSLRIRGMVDVSLSHSEGRMSRQILDVPKRPSDRRDLPCTVVKGINPGAGEMTISDGQPEISPAVCCGI